MEDAMNGHTNGSLKGGKGMNGINGHVVPRRRTPPAKTSPSFFARLFSIAARLTVWYSIYALLFQCPSTLEGCNETSPKICKPYFQVKDAVTPHLTPYYDTYAAPYVDLAKPYYETVDRTVITPTRIYAVKYGGPQLIKAQELGLAQWEKNLQPQLARYQTLAKSQYDQAISPHVDKASTVVAPYYNIAKANALQTYHEFVLPSYLFVEPYAAQGYEEAAKFTTETAIPTSLWAWNKTFVFLDSTVWPNLRDVYVMKVEPQLVRIGERLGRYKEKKPKVAPDGVDSQSAKSTFAKPSVSVATTTATSATETPKPEATASTESEVQASTSEADVDQDRPKQSTEQIREHAAKTVAEDLELWQGKFTKAADEGASEIEERVDEISSRMIEHHANVMGKSLVSQLEETANIETTNLKKTLLTILEKNKDAKKETLEGEVAAAVREAGLNIKSKAQDIRTWRQTYEQEMEISVTKVAEEHIRILQSIRDLALQKLGMKWAWMDGITYKDWQKYHQLRARLDEWTEDLKRLVVTHPGLANAQAAGTAIEDAGMGIAGEAAQELGSLKQITLWKAAAGDLTDNFDANTMKLAAEAAEKKAVEAADALNTIAGSVEEGIHNIVDAAEQGDVPASESISGDVSVADSSESTPTVTIALSEADQDAETSAAPPLESIASEPTDSAAEPVKPLPTSEPVDGPEQVEETIVASPQDPSSSAGSATPSIKKVMFGAAAQSVPSRQPIMDEDFESSFSSVASVVQSDFPHTITSAAQSAYTAAIAQAADHYSRAMSVVSVQINGEPKPVHEEMLSSVSNAYFDALASANSGLAAALTAASEGVYGTPTTKWIPDMPTMPSMPSVEWERIQSIAQQNLQDGVSWASEKLESAKVAIGAAEPTPSTPSEKAQKMLDQASHQYYAGLGVAHARYSEFLAAASSTLSSLTATPTPTNIQGTFSSVASVASESAASVAIVAGEGVADAGETVSETWESLVSRISSGIYGAPIPTPWYENFYAAAGDYAASATDVAESYASQAGDYAASATGAAGSYASHASEYVAENLSSITSAAGEYAGSATSAADAQYSAVSSLLSELVYGKEPTFTESVFSRLAGAYSVATSNVASLASEATDSASAATDSVKDTVQHIIDEL
ncbi:uncharacterized protein BCR38DRAFT_351655 [Pseudomassariella vexata]|uniref:Transcription factor hoxa13 n=1 Tax=Pseudomassariella vexata TaxID=1141098 RepID=A0A1Y2DK44_9PEZI|nr:uncharacterized protein BCR38DRAFT_351655 [Pseudomassariella vexata]ORY59135.1 hypothetical protein BCR38DRAFT_351655 [Pseudomassariella vexata]